jgi:hypothetical protein
VDFLEAASFDRRSMTRAKPRADLPPIPDIRDERAMKRWRREVLFAREPYRTYSTLDKQLLALKALRLRVDDISAAYQNRTMSFHQDLQRVADDEMTPEEFLERHPERCCHPATAALGNTEDERRGYRTKQEKERQAREREARKHLPDIDIYDPDKPEREGERPRPREIKPPRTP